MSLNDCSMQRKREDEVPDFNRNKVYRLIDEETDDDSNR